MMNTQVKGNIEIKEYNDKYLEAIKGLSWEEDFVKEDILECLKQWSECSVVIEEEGIVVAVGVFTGAGSKTSLTLYVDPQKRGRGLGTRLIEILEEKMSKAGVLEAVCDFKASEQVKGFLVKNGYRDWFKSNYMVYQGPKLPVNDYEIVGYEDEDYEIAEKICSEAFHHMRLAVGMDSYLCTPSEEGKKSYAENKENIFVLKNAGEIVAMIILSGNELDAVAVDLKEQGKGYGKALISYGVNQILDKGEERVTLWAVEGNPAKELYKKLGFEVIRLHEFVEKKLV